MAAPSSMATQPKPSDARQFEEFYAEVIDTRKAERSRNARRGRIINNYRLEARISGAKQNEVFWAVDTRKDRRVVVKMIKRHNEKEKWRRLTKKEAIPKDPNHLPVTAVPGYDEKKILQEIAIMKKCRHPNIIRLHEVINDSLLERIYLIMESCDGGAVEWEGSNDEPTLRVDQTRRIMRDTILGLEYLHYQGIIHRDIKPPNLLWTKYMRSVKISDFGISHFSLAHQGRMTNESSDGERKDKEKDGELNSMAGTPPFMAPELHPMCLHQSLPHPFMISGSSDPPPGCFPSKSIDVFALGVTLYAMLFGLLPWKGSRPETFNSICYDDWTVPESFGVEKVPCTRHPSSDDESEGAVVVRILHSLLEKHPVKRMTLDQLKRHPWITQGIADPETWIRETSPYEATVLTVSDHETDTAYSELTRTSRPATRWQELHKLVKQVIGFRHTSNKSSAPPTPPSSGPSSPARAEVHRMKNFSMVSLFKPRNPFLSRKLQPRRSEDVIGNAMLPLSPTAEDDLSRTAQMNRASSWSQTGDHESYITADGGAEESIDAWAYNLTGAPAKLENGDTPGGAGQTPRGPLARLQIQGGSSQIRGRVRSATGSSSPLGLYPCRSNESVSTNGDVPNHILDDQDDDDESGTDSGSEKRFPDLFEPNRSRSPANRRSEADRSQSRYSTKQRMSDDSQEDTPNSQRMRTPDRRQSSRPRRESTPDQVSLSSLHNGGLRPRAHTTSVLRTEASGADFDMQDQCPVEDSDSDSDEPIEIARRKRQPNSGSP